MVSDGVVDAFGGEDYENTIMSIIAGLQEHNPGELSDRLMQIAIHSSAGRIYDDMTIGVIGIWET